MFNVATALPWPIYLTHDLPSLFDLGGYPFHFVESQSARFSLGRVKVLIFGNSGSWKSTYARALAAREGIPHLDLDAIVWEPGKIAVQRSPESVAASLQGFIDSHPAWVAALKSFNQRAASPKPA